MAWLGKGSSTKVSFKLGATSLNSSCAVAQIARAVITWILALAVLLTKMYTPSFESDSDMNTAPLVESPAFSLYTKRFLLKLSKVELNSSGLFTYLVNSNKFIFSWSWNDLVFLKSSMDIVGFFTKLDAKATWKSDVLKILPTSETLTEGY